MVDKIIVLRWTFGSVFSRSNSGAFKEVNIRTFACGKRRDKFFFSQSTTLSLTRDKRDFNKKVKDKICFLVLFSLLDVIASRSRTSQTGGIGDKICGRLLAKSHPTASALARL